MQCKRDIEPEKSKFLRDCIAYLGRAIPTSRLNY